MKIECIGEYGLSQSLFGLGLSHGLTSGINSWAGVPEDVKERLHKVAEKLCAKDGGHNKFLRQIEFWWDATFPRFLWQEVDQYRVGVTTQSESTIHTIMSRDLTQEDFEEPIHPWALEVLNLLIGDYKKSKNGHLFMQLKNDLPEGFLQRRVWSLSLAQMKNIYHQRKAHRLPQWKSICEAFVDATPEFLRGIYA